MQLIINHLTRMQPGYFCAAGIEPTTRLHVRPVLDASLRTELLDREGGSFSLGATLDFGQMRFVGRTPEIEDRKFDLEQVRVVESANLNKMMEYCRSVAKNALHEVFTSELIRMGASFAIPENAGLYSLGCCWVEKPMLEIVCEPEIRRLRLKWNERGQRIAVGVADIRLYEADHRSLNIHEVRQVQRWLDTTDRVLLSVGLSRPYRKSEQDRPVHWLQVNNIHYATPIHNSSEGG